MHRVRSSGPSRLNRRRRCPISIMGHFLQHDVVLYRSTQCPLFFHLGFTKRCPKLDVLFGQIGGGLKVGGVHHAIIAHKLLLVHNERPV